MMSLLQRHTDDTQVLGSVIAVVVALGVCPISGVGSSTAAATEALAEMELAATELRGGVWGLRSGAVAGGRAAGRGDGCGGPEPPAEGGGAREVPSGSPWVAAREALDRAEAASARMVVHMSSVMAYPVSMLLGKGSQGNQMTLLLCSMSPAVVKALQVLGG